MDDMDVGPVQKASNPWGPKFLGLGFSFNYQPRAF